MEPWKLAIKAVPNSSREQICGWLGQELKVRVCAPPEAGEANRRILALLAEATGLNAGDLRICAGHSSSRKLVEVTGLTKEIFHERVASP